MSNADILANLILRVGASRLLSIIFDLPPMQGA